MLSKGQGCEPDQAQAVSWFQKAAAQGLNQARNAIRNMNRDVQGDQPKSETAGKPFTQKNSAMPGNQNSAGPVPIEVKSNNAPEADASESISLQASPQASVAAALKPGEPAPPNPPAQHAGPSHARDDSASAGLRPNPTNDSEIAIPATPRSDASVERSSGSMIQHPKPWPLRRKISEETAVDLEKNPEAPSGITRLSLVRPNYDETAIRSASARPAGPDATTTQGPKSRKHNVRGASVSSESSRPSSGRGLVPPVSELRTVSSNGRGSDASSHRHVGPEKSDQAAIQSDSPATRLKETTPPTIHPNNSERWLSELLRKLHEIKEDRP
jgi:hypothetical protein